MSTYQNLDDAICLLALISDCPTGREESTQETEAREDDKELQSYANDEKFDDLEDPTMLGTDPGHEQYRVELKNQFLDRLAETLARFKTDPKSKTSNDAKHVSAAMMVCYEYEERVKIFCAKNEGLEKEDDDFLASWKLCMESIARKGYASDEDTFAMFNLVADHQWPRITTYLKSLKRVFQSNINSASVKSMPKLSLLAQQVSIMPSLRSREWEEDNGFLFAIPLHYSAPANRSAPADELTNAKSNTTCTGETLSNIQGSVSELFEKIRRLCQPNTTSEDETSLLKEVMSHMFDLWREPRARFMLKTALRREFIQQKEREALLFLGRVCYAAYIYVEIAKVSRSFQSIEIVSVSHTESQGRGRTQRRHKKTQRHTAGDEYANILAVIKALGLTFNPSWKFYLAKNAARFPGLRKSKGDKEFHHAETQLLAYFEYSMSPDDRNQSHKYIGCSRRCCWLCYALLRAHEYFGVRGTHETLLYRWNVPIPSTTGSGSLPTQLDLAMERLLMELKVSLQTLFNSPGRKNVDLKAQSSHALSSTGAIWQREPEYHNTSYRGFQHLMMMPTAFDNGLLIAPIHDKPGLYQSGSFDIPNHDGQYLYQGWAIQELENVFSIETLLRDFNNIPNIGDPEWVRFGFCYCTSRTQMELLAKAYIQLTAHASLSEIATAWKSNTLLDIMKAKGIGISALVSEGIYPRQPSPETIGIYRFMSEVSHGLSGCPSCSCKNARCKFHSKDEPLLCKQSEVDYGFHSINTYERWRLLNFYSDLFANPKFNPQKMQEATRHPDVHALETYIESLIPEFRRITWNEHMTDGMFPKINSRLKFQGGYPSCECFIHKIPVSEGVECNVNIEIDWLRAQYEERSREQITQS
ncbi:hypothetical protein PEX2_067260 [Penicillium expansum]|uniref:Uncharacterized protein n=1 Tax=Penicillium expansum TaxID=27334 RepID=A0A0A2IUV9_PENEN|nr:hypothetical protein PEX2_067260 [Penicillium expansum]KGO46243.1 hypothetical protein PEXP_098550 [Penicillium expansum]KGO58216.1 hypothetical protein PEX2_067260 [Penicillium expansum]